MHRFSAKGHEIKKDISVLLAIVSFSGECWNNGILGFVNHDGSRNILNSL